MMTPANNNSLKYVTRRWQVLFVRDDGRTVPLRRFKSWVGAVIGVGLMMLIVIGILLSRNSSLLRQNAALEKTLAAKTREAVAAGHEKDRLLAKLAIAESDLKLSRAQVPAAALRDQTNEDPQELKGHETEAQAAAESPPTVMQGEAVDEPESEASPPVAAVVSVDNLLVCYSPEDGSMHIEFKVLNVSGSTQPVSGYAFIVVKDGAETTDRWLVFPNVKLINGTPSHIKGTRFHIYRYRTLKYSIKHDEPERFTNATIFVYQQDTGELLLERDFEITGIPTCP